MQDLARAKRESLQPQEDADLGSHHATASSSSAPSQCLRPIFNKPLRFQDSPYKLQTFLLLALHLKSLNWKFWSLFLLFSEPRQKKDAVPCFFPGRPWAWWTGASHCRMASLCTMPFSPGVWRELQHKESKHIRCCRSCVDPRHGRLRRSPRLHSRQKGPGQQVTRGTKTGLARRLARTPRVLPESANAALAGDLLHQPDSKHLKEPENFTPSPLPESPHIIDTPRRDIVFQIMQQVWIHVAKSKLGSKFLLHCWEVSRRSCPTEKLEIMKKGCTCLVLSNSTTPPGTCAMAWRSASTRWRHRLHSSHMSMWACCGYLMLVSCAAISPWGHSHKD